MQMYFHLTLHKLVMGQELTPILKYSVMRVGLDFHIQVGEPGDINVKRSYRV